MAGTNGHRLRADAALLPELDLDQLVVSYDGASDTLMFYFFGRGRAAMSIPASSGGERDVVFHRVDPTTNYFVGIQIEDFIHLYAVAHPDAWAWLDHAEPRGVTSAEVARVRPKRDAHGTRPETVERLLKKLVPVSDSSV